MDKCEFKDLLFELLNEHGEQELGLVDIIPCDGEDKFIVIEPDEHRFEVAVKQLQ